MNNAIIRDALRAALKKAVGEVYSSLHPPGPEQIQRRGTLETAHEQINRIQRALAHHEEVRVTLQKLDQPELFDAT